MLSKMQMLAKDKNVNYWKIYILLMLAWVFILHFLYIALGRSQKSLSLPEYYMMHESRQMFHPSH